MHVNVKGLRLNLEELLFSLNKKKIDIASIKQTFSEKKKQNNAIPGYWIVRKDQSSVHDLEVALFLRDYISYNTFKLDINTNRGKTIINILCNFISHERILFDDRDPHSRNKEIKYFIHEKKIFSMFPSK